MDAVKEVLKKNPDGLSANALVNRPELHNINGDNSRRKHVKRAIEAGELVMNNKLVKLPCEAPWEEQVV